MGTKVFACRIGNKFGQDVEDYIESKLPNVTWIRDELDGVRLQWNKMRVMNMDIDEPVVVIDIDLEFINDYINSEKKERETITLDKFRNIINN